MSLRHAILTALIERPSSGLDLVRRFDRSIRYFWSASHQQIYVELRGLEAAGLVTSTPQPGTRGNRKLYEVLDAGRDELRMWVSTFEAARPMKDPLLLRLRAASIVGAGSLTQQMREQYAIHQQQLAEYLAIAERDFTGELMPTAQMQHRVLQAGIGLERFWMTWIEETIATMEATSGHEGRSPRSSRASPESP